MDTKWFQQTIEIPPVARGLHLITDRIVEVVPELSQLEVGLLQVFILHTSASLTINENVDSDVPRDLEAVFTALAPESFPYRHTCEGVDDMPAHVKVALTQSGLTIPVRSGRLCLGTWQGIFLWEHRNHGGPRRLVVTLQGQAIE